MKIHLKVGDLFFELGEHEVIITGEPVELAQLEVQLDDILRKELKKQTAQLKRIVESSEELRRVMG